MQKKNVLQNNLAPGRFQKMSIFAKFRHWRCITSNQFASEFRSSLQCLTICHLLAARDRGPLFKKKTKQPSKTIFDQILAISITKFNAWVDQLIPIQFHFMLDFTDLNQFYLNLKKTVTTCSKCLGISNLRLCCEGPFSTFPLNCSLRMFYWKFTCYKI